MAGTVNGGRRAAETNKKLYGKGFYGEIGRRGGLKKVPKGFALNLERARSAGAKGGRISKRGSKPCLYLDCTKGAWKNGYCHDHYMKVYAEEHHE